MVINRVVTNTPSVIFGTLSSNGNLVLVNQAGIAVGAGAIVDTAGFTASSLRMTDADAIAGRMRFGDGTLSATGVSVQGSILARSGDVVLIGASVDTGADALIQSPNGNTILAAGQQIEITGRGLEGISLQVQAPTDSAVNLGTLKGDAVGIFAGTLKHSGAVQATAVTTQGGKVFLKAQALTQIGGDVFAQGPDGKGGAIHATAEKVFIESTALLDASGDSGGGEVLIGGGWQGHDGRLANAKSTTAETGSTIKANATGNGNGGTVVVWADDVTRVGSRIEARGGLLGGNGGSVETSGKGRLVFRASVDTSAAQGRAGYLLLDPRDITIVGGTGGANDSLLADNQILANEPDTVTDVTISELTLEGLSGNVTLTASRDVILSNLADNLLNMSLVTNGSTFAINAGRDISGLADVNDRFQTNGGAVTMTTTNGQINIGGILSQGGNVTLNAGGAGGNLVVREIKTTPAITGIGGNISLTSGGFTTLGGGDIDARGNASLAGNVTIASSGAVNMQLNKTIYANELRIDSVGGITNSSIGSVAIQAAKVRAYNTGSGDIRLEHTGANAIQIYDLISGLTAGVNNSASGGVVYISSTLGQLNVGSSILSNAADIFLFADKMDIQKSINSGSNALGRVAFVPWNNGTAIDVGSATNGAVSTLELSNAELSNVTSGLLRVGDLGYTGGLQVTQALGPWASVGTLSLVNGGTVTQSGTGQISAAKLNADGVLGVTLNLSNQVTTLAGRSASGNFSFTNNGALTIGTAGINSGIVLTGGGNISLTATSASGNIDVQQPLNTTGVVSISAANTLSGSGVISAGTLNLTNGTGGISLTASNQIANLNPGGTGGAISIKNNKANYALNVGTVSGLTITGTGTVNVGSWTSSGVTSISSDSGITAGSFNTSGSLSLYSLGAVSVASGGGLTVTNASGSSVSLSSSGSSVSINGSVTSAGNISISGYSSTTFTGATVASSGGTLSASSSMGGVDIDAGSVMSGKTMNFSAASDVQVNGSTLRPGGVGSTGVLNVTSGNLKMNGGSRIELDVISATDFDKVNITGGGALAVLSSSEGITVADRSFGLVSGPLGFLSASGGIGGAGLPLVFTGPIGWTLTTGANALTLNAVPAPSNGTADLVSTFLENFTAALASQQASADDEDKAKDVLVVEGEICRP
jgi:hypothetical protein